MPAPSYDNKTHRRLLYTVFDQYIGNLLGPYDSGDSVSWWDYQTVSSVNTPGFRLRKKASLPINAYEKVIGRLVDRYSYQQVYRAPPTNDVIYNHYQWTHEAAGMNSYFQPLALPHDPTSQVVSKLLKSINSSKTNTLVAAAELSKTAEMVASSATRIYNAVRALRRGHLGDFSEALGISVTRTQKDRWTKRFRSYKKYRKTRIETKGTVREFAQSTWLEYSYGWKPLLSDVYAHAEALGELQVERQNVVRRLTARHKNTIDKEETINFVTALWHNKTSGFHDVQLTVLYRLPNSGIVNPMKTFGVINPLEVAWELVPFSFVVDWFVPIGDAIRSLTATHGLEFAGGWYDIKQKTTVSCRFTSTGKSVSDGGYQRSLTIDESEFMSDGFRFKRVPIYEFPTPVLPEFKDPRSIVHATSAIALLSSLFLTEKRGAR